MKIWLRWFLLLLLSACAPAQLLPGDPEAKSGDYPKALAAYEAATTGADEATLRRLLCRKLAVAQATNNVFEARTIGKILEKKLGSADDPQVALRLYLCRMAIATRTRDLKGAFDAYQKAWPLAQRLVKMGDPVGALGSYECLSYQFLGTIATRGRPTTAEYEAALQKAYLASVQPTATAANPLWPMDAYRSMYWTRLWIWQAWEYSYLAYRQSQPEEYSKWATVALKIGQNGIALCQQLYAVSRDPEVFIVTCHLTLELTESFAAFKQVEEYLQTLEPALEAFPDTLEMRFLKGRCARSKARSQYFARNNRAAALEEYKKAADWFARGGQRIDQMDISIELAYMYTLESAPADWEPEVARRLQELVTMSEKYSYPNGRYFGLGFQGVLKARGGHYAEAEKLLRHSLTQLSTWSRETKESSVARAQSLQKPEVRLFSDTLVEILLKQNRHAEALEASQAIKSEAESAGIDLTRIVPKDPESAKDLQQLEKARLRSGQLRTELQSAQVQGNQVAVQELQGQLASSKADFVKTVNRLRQRDPDFEKLLSVKPSSFAKLQAQLPAGVLVVEYYTSADKLIVFAVTNKELQIFSSPLGRKDVMDKVRALRRATVERKSALSESGQLYTALIAPLEPLLKDNKVLAVIPSGYLYYLPFSALTNPQGKYLNETVSVCLLTATELPEVGSYKSSGKPTSLLALANPDGSLPGASREVEELAKLFPTKNTYLGAEATKDKISGKGDVLHVATHGNLNPRDVNESFLLLAGKDGHLTAGEIYGLDLKKVTLVVLSACETALGEGNPGSEVATLAQAFSFAGSRSMIASLWQVEDDSTAHLMLEFYRHLLAGQGKAESLRLAQLSVRQQSKWSNPYYWAGFELIGDWH